MTLAVVLVTEAVEGRSEPGPTAGLPYGPDATVLERLLDQLASLNVHDSRIIARREIAAPLRTNRLDVIETDGLDDDLRAVAELARTAEQPMVFLPGDIVASDELLTRIVHDARGAASAVISRRPPGAHPACPVVRTDQDRIVSAGSRYHRVTDPDAVFPGVLRVDPPATRTLADVADELAALSGTFAAAAAPCADDVPALLLTGLVRAGVRVRAYDTGVLVGERVRTGEQAAAARAAVAAVDEDRVRLAAAVKSDDGFFTTYAVSSYSWRIARWAARRRLTPNMVTSISMGVAVLAAVWFAAGTRLGMVAGALLLYAAFVLDCVDGQLARYTRQFSTLGAWLDATFDRAKEYVAYAGLAVGSTAAAAGSAVHGGNVWRLAAGAMALQTCRHMVDFAFGAAKLRTSGGTELPILPLSAPDDRALDSPPTAVKQRKGPGHLAIWLSNRTEKIPGLRWAKKIVVLPIGERFALISVSAALFNAKVTFLLLICWGLLAAGYILTGRILRSIA
jgi:hypothetical protein